MKLDRVYCNLMERKTRKTDRQQRNMNVAWFGLGGFAKVKHIGWGVKSGEVLC